MLHFPLFRERKSEKNTAKGIIKEITNFPKRRIFDIDRLLLALLALQSINMNWEIVSQESVPAGTRVSKMAMSRHAIYLCVFDASKESWRIEKFQFSTGRFLGSVPVHANGLSKMEYSPQADSLFCLSESRSEISLIPCDDTDDWVPETWAQRSSFILDDIRDASLAADGAHIFVLMEPLDRETSHINPECVVLRHAWRTDDPIQIQSGPTQLEISTDKDGGFLSIHANPVIPDQFIILSPQIATIMSLSLGSGLGDQTYTRVKTIRFNQLGQVSPSSKMSLKWSNDGSQFVVFDSPFAFAGLFFIPLRHKKNQCFCSCIR